MITTPGALVKKIKLDGFTLIALCACASAVFLALCVIWSDPWWGYAAIAASLAGVAVYAADMLIPRYRVRPAPADDPPEAAAETGPESARDPEPAPGPEPEPGRSDAIVATIPGRRRFHNLNCDLVSGDAYEAITEVEARAEGFSPCTACRGAGTKIRSVD